MYFLIHIETAQDEVDKIVNESYSGVAVLDRQRIENFIQKAVLRSLANNTKSGVQIDLFSKPLDIQYSSSSSNAKSTSSKDTGFKTKESNVKKSEIQSTRMISGERIVASVTKFSQSLKRDCNEVIEKPEPCSPFSDAFINEGSMFDTASTLKLSFEDAFMSSKQINLEHKINTKNNNDIEGESTENKAWTRQRLLAPDAPLLSKLQPTRHYQKGISLTKEMLSNATVIGQLDAKFIVIKADKHLCIVDQHAAHERVQLERLEKKVLSNIFSPGLKSAEKDDAKPIIIDGEKNKHWKEEEFELKTFPLMPVQIIDLSPTDKMTITQMKSILSKWKFSFQFSNTDENKIVLNGAPKVCGKIASSDDFIDFVHELESRQVDAELCKPAFISRVLASHACRYGIMFGDILSMKQCNDLIKAFSKCKFPFICAHGRPSVVPLFNAEEL